MGQYHVPVNITKRQFFIPHGVGDGLKLWEQAVSEGGVASALLLLMACAVKGGPRGGGDPKAHPLLGQWAGDQIVVLGDYADYADCPAVWDACGLTGNERDKQGYKMTPYSAIIHNKDGWTDITSSVRDMLTVSLGYSIKPPDYAPGDWNAWLTRTSPY